MNPYSYLLMHMQQELYVCKYNMRLKLKYFYMVRSKSFFLDSCKMQLI